MHKAALLTLSITMCVSTARAQLSDAAALKAVFGNYDATKNAAIVSGEEFLKARTVKEEHGLDCIKDQLVETPSRIVARVLFKKQTIEDQTSKTYVVFSGIPANWKGAGRPCGVAIGAAVFSKASLKWKIASSSQWVVNDGTYGFPPTAEWMKLVKIGKQKHGVAIEYADMNRGYQWSWVILVAPVGESFKAAWHLPLHYDNSGTCSSDEKEREAQQLEQCYGYSISYNFVPKDNSDYFDLKLISRGSNQNRESGRVEEENWTAIYRWNSDHFAEISREKNPPDPKFKLEPLFGEKNE